jgi:transcriptional regulator with XRE-family HTH domain
MHGTAKTAEGKPTMTDGVGEFLRRERELRHISLDEVAARTKISRRYLEAIEAGRYERLPGETFVRGFIRSYAQSVGLDPEDTILMYNQARAAQERVLPHPERIPPQRSAQGARSLLWLLVAGLVVVGGVLFALLMWREGWGQLRPWGSAREAPSSAASGGPPLVLTVSADSDTWVHVVIDEREAQDVLLRAGTSIKWTGRERFVVSIGNLWATHLKLNGRELSPPPSPRSILRHYTIARDMLQ